MNKIVEAIKRIEKDENLKKQFAEAVKDKKVVEFLNSHGCQVTKEEVKEFLKAKKAELSDEEVEKAVGGSVTCRTIVLTITGIGCGIVSAYEKGMGSDSCNMSDWDTWN